MKKLLLFLICTLTALALTACGEEHKHDYAIKKVDSTYLATEADCENAATYFHSCSCGAKGTTTFTHGDASGHSYTVKNTDSKYLNKAADCENAATYYYSCSCGDKGTTTFTHGDASGHSYVIQNVDPKYEKTPASEYGPALYWKSCSCGEASTTEFFEYGNKLPGYLTYQLSNNSSFYIVTGFVGSEKNIDIPHIYDALPVFSIMENAFKDNTTLEGITMPNSIQEIGPYAFAGCTSLESVSLPTSVKSISSYTFSGCTALETITLHSGIKKLGAFAFENCTALKSITLNEGLETISDNAFDNCSALEGISIPDTVTSLGNMAFRDAVSLKYVKFSKALESIGNATFENCISLESVELHENTTSLGNSTFSDCRGLKSLRILGDLTNIGSSTFYDCRALESIYFASKTPKNCGNANYIFYNAGIEGEGITLTVAKDAIIPDGFFTPYVEDNMPKITTIIFEDGTTMVNGFENYNRLPYLTSITYPSTVTDPCYGAFNNSLWWENQDYGEVFIDDVFYGYKCHCKIATPKAPVIENSVDSTCTEKGSYDTVIYCEKCYDELKRSNTVTAPEKGHSPKAAVEERVEATTCVNGSYDSVVYCGTCNVELSRETIVTIKATHKNTKELKCSECGEKTTYYRDGNYIYFGEYPQSIKEDNVTVTSTQDERGYYLGSDGFYYAKVVAYPNELGCVFSNGVGVTDGGTYYFKVESIRWRILSEDGETAFILCDSIIANQRYDDSSNNYKESEIRAWLNASFYETAFTELQREIILITEVDNSAYSTGYSSNPYACEDTEDKIFLLSYREVTNGAYGLSSYYDREMQTGDYSRATGAWMSTSSSYYGNGYWLLRSPNYSYDYSARLVDSDGDVVAIDVSHSYCGVVPALQIRL